MIEDNIKKYIEDIENEVYKTKKLTREENSIITEILYETYLQIREITRRK